ncbi:MAG: hypothetical protein ACTSVI_00620 [Promethearchaeota archaeon]
MVSRCCNQHYNPLYNIKNDVRNTIDASYKTNLGDAFITMTKEPKSLRFQVNESKFILNLHC